MLVTDLLMGVVEAVSEDEKQRYAVCFLSFCLLSVGNVWVVRTFALEVSVAPECKEFVVGFVLSFYFSCI